MTENWNPGHSINKGWPYNGIFSQETFRNRLGIWQDPQNKEIVVDINEKTWGKVEIAEKRTPFESFLMLRLYDYAVALKLAEDQITELLSESPFLPEDMGFEQVVKHKEGEPPMRIYVSTFDENYSMFRKPGDPMDPKWNPSIWTVIIGKLQDGHKVFKEVDIVIPCARIGYAALSALGLKMGAPVKAHEKPVKKGVKTYKLNFKCNDDPKFDQDFDIEVDKGCNEKDATQKLEFLLRTGVTHLGTVDLDRLVDWKISVIPSQQSKRQQKKHATEPPAAESN